MQIKENLHLTYCTNIHAGESWEEAFLNLQVYIPSVKATISPKNPFGIGLRLSYKAAIQLIAKENLQQFKAWLSKNDCYVFTMNGFPFGGFHHQTVKDQVHQPDWTTLNRLDYTNRLFLILAAILPQGMDGGISTSPLSYKLWHKTEAERVAVLEQSTQNIIKILDELIELKSLLSKDMHLDIEPEPDGLLENSQDFFDFYDNYLLPMGIAHLKSKYNFSDIEAEEAIKNHIQLCYDVCHFAVAYENHAEVLEKCKAKGIKIGKFQISAALKADLSNQMYPADEVLEELAKFNESTYLHQVIAQTRDKQLKKYPDLPIAFQNIDSQNDLEWRIHFHVPIFLEKYGKLQSTQTDISQVVDLLKHTPYSNHLEIETYTWEVLPEDLKLPMLGSLQREFIWLMKQINT